MRSGKEEYWSLLRERFQSFFWNISCVDQWYYDYKELEILSIEVIKNFNKYDWVFSYQTTELTYSNTLLCIQFSNITVGYQNSIWREPFRHTNLIDSQYLNEYSSKITLFYLFNQYVWTHSVFYCLEVMNVRLYVCKTNSLRVLLTSWMNRRIINENC